MVDESDHAISLVTPYEIQLLKNTIVKQDSRKRDRTHTTAPKSRVVVSLGNTFRSIRIAVYSLIPTCSLHSPGQGVWFVSPKYTSMAVLYCGCYPDPCINLSFYMSNFPVCIGALTIYNSAVCPLQLSTGIFYQLACRPDSADYGQLSVNPASRPKPLI